MRIKPKAKVKHKEFNQQNLVSKTKKDGIKKIIEMID